MDYNKNGKTFSFSLDFDRILDLEAKDEDYSFLDEMSHLGDGKFRLTTLDRMCFFIGTTYKDFIGLGLGIEDLTSIIVGCLKESGFFSDSPDSV